MDTDKNVTQDQSFEFPVYYNKHYIDVDDRGRIIEGWSDGPHPDMDAARAICINEEGGYQFRLPVYRDHILFDGTLDWAPELTEENPSLWTMDGIPLYKWEDGEVLKRTQEEISADRAAIPEPPPTAQERMEAQVAYTAMMTDTLLGEG